ncbi:MAG: hypothetical protein FWB74_01190 [Defluviitaleaceae bacterium]|nr:hypothetical protein [Defluviitaleaceae bacterium]
MLTAIHYFGQYRDFALRASSGRNNNFNGALYSRRTHSKQTASAVSLNTVSTPTVQLNRAYSANVMNYIRLLGQNVVTMKDASRLFVSGSNSLEATGGVNFEGHLRWIDEDLRNFTNSYNNLDYLARRAELTRGSGIADFAHSIRTITQGHEPYLSHLGIITADDGGVMYHGIGTAATQEITRSAADAFRATYEASREFLANPMSAHLEFKNLNYYYSYTIGNTPQSAYLLVESGILVNRLI